MFRLSVFVVISMGFVYLSRGSLRRPQSHGFYRFFAWESLLVLFLLNVGVWFNNPFSWHQLISWFLLLISIVPLVLGVHALITRGEPVTHRKGGEELLAFEKTSRLVTSGIYRYVRHPLYSSLLLLTWGIFFKAPTWFGGLLGLMASLFLLAAAKAEERECIRFFGVPYRTYMERTRMFLPFLF